MGNKGILDGDSTGRTDLIEFRRTKDCRKTERMYLTLKEKVKPIIMILNKIAFNMKTII